MPYDVLLVACGAVPVPALPGAATFRGPADVEMVRSLLDELEAGAVRSVAFTVPWGVVWSLPAYELALMTAAHVAARELADVSIALATPEQEPLQLFGKAAVEEVQRCSRRGVALHTGVYASDFRQGRLACAARPARRRARGRAAASARSRDRGTAADEDRFDPVDSHGRVQGPRTSTPRVT